MPTTRCASSFSVARAARPSSPAPTSASSRCSRPPRTALAYERDGAARSARLERVKKPVIAQIQGFAVGGGFGITACCDIRIATPDAKFGAPIARTLGNCLSMDTYARFVDLLGTSLVKDVIFRARFLTAQEALAAGYVHEIVAPEEIEARVKAIAPGDRRPRPHHHPGHQGVAAPDP